MKSFPQSFINKYSVENSGCWEWIAAKTSKYGKYWNPIAKKSEWSHRFAYVFMKGNIPDGLELDHLCKNRSCVNPDHLEPVTHLENMARAKWHKIPKTHCPANHPYSITNTYVSKDGWRKCKICSRENLRRFKLRQKYLSVQRNS